MWSPPADDRRSEREAMVLTQIRGRGIRDERVIAAMLAVPRHRFVPEAGAHAAYDDRPLPIGDGQTISQPYMVAVMTELLALTGEERVLEIGTGSGYQTAVLSLLAREVFTIERKAVLAAAARTALSRLGADNVYYRVGDGSLGWPEQAPFDAVVVTAAAPDVPGSLLAGLAESGRLVAPVGERSVQDLVTVRRDHGRLVRSPCLRCIFVPLVGAEGYPEE